MNNMNELVTLAIASYNNAKYIERCVKSVIAQTYSNLEILLVDDGSTDDSLQRVEKYKSEGRLRVITKENGGLSSVRQVSLDEAKGDYICFIDADDYILENYVSEMLSQINKDGSNICISSTRFEDEKGSVNYSDTSFFRIPKNKIPLDCSDEVLLNNPSQVIKDLHLSDSWNKMYSTSFLRDTNVSFSMPKGLNGTDSSFNKKIVFLEAKSGLSPQDYSNCHKPLRVPPLSSEPRRFFLFGYYKGYSNLCIFIKKSIKIAIFIKNI